MEAQRLTYVALAIVASVAAGCGSSVEIETPDERAEVREVVHSYLKATAAGDSKTACSKLTGQLQRDLIDTVAGDDPYPPTCRELIRYITDLLGPDEKTQITRNSQSLDQQTLTIRGTRAIFKTHDGRRLIGLTKHPDAGWLIATLWPAWYGQAQGDQNR